MGRPRSSARLATREAQGWCEARRLCSSKDSDCSQSFPEESKEAPTQKVEPLPGSLLTVTSPPIMSRELARDCKAQAGAAKPPRRRGIGLGKFLEDFRLLLRGHADAAIGHAQLDPVAAVADPARSKLDLAFLVNLQALLRRLSKTCRSLMGSTVRAPKFSCAPTTSRFLFCAAS